MYIFSAITASEAINYSKLLTSLLQYTITTVELFFVTLLIALPLGLMLAVGRMSRFAFLRIPISLLLTVVRGTPLMLQLVLFLYGPSMLFGIQGFPRLLTAFIAFGINYACYFAEIYRGGIQSIPVGQWEAAEATGFTKKQTFFRIILPQVIKNILPAMGNEFMTLVKDTSLARTIAVEELLYITETKVQFYASIIPLLIAGAFYLIMNIVVSRLFAFAEKKLSYYQ